MDDSCLPDPSLQGPSALLALARSWPPTKLPTRCRPEPPKAPPRRPAPAACSEVPPLVLTPTAAPPRPLRATGAAPGSGEEDDEEPCVFALEALGGGPMTERGEEDEQLELSFQYDLAGLYDESDCMVKGVALCDRLTASFFSTGQRSSMSSGVVPSLGASPVLLSAIEQLAAESEQLAGLSAPSS